MEIVKNCLILTLCLAYIVDITGITIKLSRWVFSMLYGKYLKYNGWTIPLISCSTCLSFWSVLCYTMLCHDITFIACLGMACFCSYIASISSEIMKLIKRGVSALCNNYL